MPGLGGEVISRLGATPKLLSGGEIYQALQTGAIDGTEWVGPWNDLAYGFYKEAPYYAWPGFHEPGTALACGMNLEVWNTLSATQQAAVRYACQSVHDEAAGEFAMMNARALKTLTEEHGVEMVRLPDEVLRAAAEASRDVLQRTAQRDEMSRRIHDSFRKALIQLSAWSRVGDEAFLDARRRYALAD
jgi:TRAP-type mannitol/chloroaromatic compound transport system substrate-binding protein